MNLGVKNDIEIVRINEDRDPEEHVDHWDPDNNKVIRPVYNSPYNIPNSFMIHNLHDGKLNKNFFSVFMLELFRDYLIGGKSYLNPNISNILRLTGPSNIRKTSGDIKTGSGDFSHYYPPVDPSDFTPKQGLFSFNRKEILDFKGKVRKIMIPEVFNNKEINSLIQNYNFKLEVINPKNQPLVIKDIKSIANSRVYTSIENIDKGIMNLNHTLAKKIHDINENIKPNRSGKPPISEQLFLHHMMRKI